MAVKDILRRLIGYRLGGSGMTEMAIPPGWNYESYLQAYGTIGWLFGAVSLIANSVAASEWKLYRQSKGEDEEIDTHPLLDILHHVNPFQTRYQFILLLETYVELVGEAFIVLNYNRLGVPVEMWLAPPSKMNIVPSSTNYISHYEYNTAGNTLRLEIAEVIHVMNPNPANPYRGTGATRSIATDLDAELYSSRYQQRLFYNDARPGMMLEFPDIPPIEERKRLREEWNEVHQGWRNAYKTAFLWGGAKANNITMTNKDMDFVAIKAANKKVILGAYHIPDSLMGASEVGSRARAEADEYIFAKYTIKPALIRITEALNEQFCPLFDENLKLTFVDPVPVDAALKRQENRDDFQAGIITREEARLTIGMDAEAEGTFLLPFNLISTPAKAVRRVVKSQLNDEQKEAQWKAYATTTEAEEKLFISELRKQWRAQEEEVIKRLKNADNPDDALFSRGEAEDTFGKAFEPIIGKVFEHHYSDAQGLVQPKNPHTDSVRKQEGLLNTIALAWICSRSLTMAKLLNGTTIEQLRAVLAEGFELGESVPKLAGRVTEYYGKANKARSLLVARTETIAASSEGAIQGYENVGVEKVEWYTALDERTCEECMAEHGKEYAISESRGMIPLHPACRCTFLAVIN